MVGQLGNLESQRDFVVAIEVLQLYRYHLGIVREPISKLHLRQRISIEFQDYIGVHLLYDGFGKKQTCNKIL